MADWWVSPSAECHGELWAEMASRKSRKAGLPKRDPPWSAGGHCWMVSSIEERVDKICLIRSGASSTAIEDIFFEAAASESEKTKDRMSS